MLHEFYMWYLVIIEAMAYGIPIYSMTPYFGELTVL